MELSKIVIKNFRSIKDEQISFDSNCLILLGKNEAGKSNILKAIAAVFGNYPVQDKDKRKRIDTEKIDDYFVRAVLRLSKAEIQTIVNRLKKQFTNHDKIVFNSQKTLIECAEFFLSEILIQINISNDKKPHYSRWLLKNTDFDLIEPLYNIENDIVLTAIGSNSYLKMSYSYWHRNYI